MPCKSRIIGRENRCCCLSTTLGMLLIGLLNLFLFICAVLNFIRVIKVAWDPITWVGLLIATLRELTYLMTCKDSIATRRNFMWAMFLTTCLEGAMLFWQVSSMISSTTQLCGNSVVPTFKMSCPAGALTLIEIMNWFFMFLYFYFSAVAYEYWLRGHEDPKLIKLEAVREEQERARKEKEKAAKQQEK